jgi:hypothetical protein
VAVPVLVPVEVTTVDEVLAVPVDVAVAVAVRVVSEDPGDVDVLLSVPVPDAVPVFLADVVAIPVPVTVPVPVDLIAPFSGASTAPSGVRTPRFEHPKSAPNSAPTIPTVDRLLAALDMRIIVRRAQNCSSSATADAG